MHRLYLYIVLCVILFLGCTSTSKAASRKIVNSTFPIIPTTGKIEKQTVQSKSSRFDQNYYDDENIFKEEKKSDDGDDDGININSNSTPIPIQNNNVGTSRSCQGATPSTGTSTVTNTDLTGLISTLGSGASGLIEIGIAVVVILAIIWIKIIAIAIIWYWWIGVKGESGGGGGGYGYSPQPQPMYGPPQQQYGAPSSYSSSRSLTDTFNLDTISNYVWKAIDFFTEMNDSKTDEIVDNNKTN